MKDYNKVIIEIVHNVDYQSVYHLQFHPSPILFCGNKEITSGNGQPFGTVGIFKHLRDVEKIEKVNIYTNLSTKDLDELMEGFRMDAPQAQFKIYKIK